MTITELVTAAHELAKSKGWWPEGEPVNIPEKLALIHSEVSEALEEYRGGTMGTVIREGGKPEGFDVELADIVIRVADLCGRLSIDLERIIAVKHGYNMSRPYRHGGKRC